MSGLQSTRLMLRRISSQIPCKAIPTHSRCLHIPSTLRVACTPPGRIPRIRRISQLLPHRAFSLSSSSRQDASALSPTTESQSPNPDVPAYQMTFTCKKCETRSTHRVSKQGYHNGTVLVTCPGCKNRHLIADHLKIFSDTRITIEDILKEKGQLVKRGILGADGDIEFWDAGGETTPHSSSTEEKDVKRMA